MKILVLLTVISFSATSVFAQVGIGTTTPDSSAQLDVSSTKKGFLPPRMTTAQRDSIINPAEGLQIFNTTTKCLEIYALGYWQAVFCAQPLVVTDCDGNIYSTVTIGTQTWMLENLKTTKYRDCSPIPNVSDSISWSVLTTGAYCNYNNDTNNVNENGRLYNWYAVDTSTGHNIAPVGWHVPNDSEWNVLNSNYNNSITFWTLGGFRFDNTEGGAYGFDAIGMTGYWWSATQGNIDYVPYRYSDGLQSNEDIYGNRKEGMSVRCIKN